MENHALDIIDMLYNMIAEAWGVPLGNDKCIVERDKALNLLDDLKATLPMELSEARRLVNARDEFVANAKQEAENIRREAEEKAAKLIDGQTVFQEAKRQADETLQRAKEKSDESFRLVYSKLDESLCETEKVIVASLDMVRAKRAEFRAAPVRLEGTADVTLQDVEDSEFIDG